ncbi:tetratricopeptide repeat protein [Pontibacter actiniarum]|uniref:Aerotolerance protein n=1 Tax=Pontibacter actiniarum TaxID=323450 RepID=A0A1X9YT95_9BACT|nr:tetratricopeptide repeat protein [Pontibacter actiniarum]ARS36061.1 aerotolerance protein [Pontibacter actiniarum]
MKAAFLAVLLLSLFSGGITAISRINASAKEAAAAYARKDYIEAIASYKYLVEDLGVQDDQLRLNLAHSYYQAGLYPQAMGMYQLLADHPTQHLRALAHLQLGNINTKQRKYKRALALYRQALVAEPGNDAARYNYELLKKYLELHPEAAKEDEEELPAPEDTPAEQDSLQAPPPASEEELEPQPRMKPDEQGQQEEEIDKPEPDQDGQQAQQAGARPQDAPQGSREREEAAGKEPGDKEGQQLNSQFDPNQQQRSTSGEDVSDEDQRAQTRRTRLRQANMSPEKAKLLLDAMRNAELQYIQQLPKKSSQSPDRSKPDW